MLGRVCPVLLTQDLAPAGSLPVKISDIPPTAALHCVPLCGCAVSRVHEMIWVINGPPCYNPSYILDYFTKLFFH